MKNLLFILLFLINNSFSFSQSHQSFKQPNLSFKECEDDINKKKCFNNIIAQKLTNSVKKEIKDYLNTNKNKDYVVNRASFVIGENGKVLKGSINTTKTKNAEVNFKLKQAILDLPEIIVRRNEYNYPVLTHYKISIQNGVNKNNDVVVLNVNNKSKGASKKTNMVAPIYKGCKSKDNEELKKCLSNYVSKLVGQKFNTKKALKGFNKKGSFYTFVFFTVDKKGDLSNLKAFGPNKAFQDQALLSLKKIKKITPGTKEGKPINVSFSLPIKMKID